MAPSVQLGPFETEVQDLGNHALALAVDDLLDRLQGARGVHPRERDALDLGELFAEPGHRPR